MSAAKRTLTDIATALEVLAGNRPVEPPHAKAIRHYLMTTACAGDLFILPSFTFNYGVELTDEDPVAILVVFGNTDDSTNAWPAMFLLPAGAKLDTTDGAHRRSQIEDILAGSKATDEQKDALRRNAVDLKIVFEANRQSLAPRLCRLRSRQVHREIDHRGIRYPRCPQQPHAPIGREGPVPARLRRRYRQQRQPVRQVADDLVPVGGPRLRRPL